MSLSVQMINKMSTIKAQDTSTEIVMKLIDGNGLAFDMTGATAKVLVGTKAGKVFEKTMTLGTNRGEVKFKMPSTVTSGLGKLLLEVVVTKGGENFIFPSDGFIEFTIQNNLTATGVTFKASGS